MIRHLLFRHYWWLALGCAAAVVIFSWRMATTDRLAVVGAALPALLGACYFAQQQKLAETELFRDLFTRFNERYDRLNERLQVILDRSRFDGDRAAAIDYFNLCAEEYLFFTEGYIHPKVWRAWCRGMRHYLERDPFRALWIREVEEDSYYGLTMEEIRKGAGH